MLGLAPDPDDRAALAWAADEASRRRLPLMILHALAPPTPTYSPAGPAPRWIDWTYDLQTAAERLLADALSFVTTRHPQLVVGGVITEGVPAHALATRSQKAALIVVGSWHLSPARQALAAAGVAVPLAARASCPVVIVPEPEPSTAPAPRIVVGVDGSSHSATALAFAFNEAALHKASLQALYVWHPPMLGTLDEHAAIEECRRILADLTASRSGPHPHVAFHGEVVKGHPVKTLTDASHDALALVVGTRGHGGFTGLLLGSVSQGVLHYARCPVVTVPRTA
ncbi:universal stress protein [Streptomyces sp. NPDC015139]|uniref:universal stress protein n=1 Tax=Streptomyces sp. NPDC015139 TaxID=3364942 RepID=UPI0036F9C7BB